VLSELGARSNSASKFLTVSSTGGVDVR
jgi:hypothetical protein